MKDETRRIKDGLFKSAGIPVIGIAVFNISGFQRAGYESVTELLFHYLCFCIISALMWNGNVYGHYLLRKQLTAIRKLYYRLPARYIITFFFSSTAIALASFKKIAFPHKSSRTEVN